MVKPKMKMLCSDYSHMALQYVWRESGVTQKHGFDLQIDVANIDLPGQERVGMDQRAPLLLDGTYDFLSGLHHETYIYRARGDKRLVYLAQAQNDWDDRVIATPDIKSARDLEGKKIIFTSSAPCVLGNLKHSLQLGGADLNKIEFVTLEEPKETVCHSAVEAVAQGKAAAASIDIPYDRQAEKKGLQRLNVPTVPVIHNATMCANREWVEANKDSAIAFLKSMVDAIHFFKTQKAKVCEILEKHMAPVARLTPDEVEHLHTSWSGLLSPKPYPHPLAVWNVYNLDVAHDPRVNFIGPFEIWDTSLLRDIDDSGYIDELYGGAQKAANPEVNAAI